MRKLFSEPAILVLLLAVVISVIFQLISYKQKKALADQVGELNAKVEDLSNLQVGDLAPPMDVEAKDGGKVKLSYREGEKYLLIVFSPWCRACKTQKETVWNELASKAKAKGYKVAGVLMDSRENGMPFLQDHPFEFDVCYSEPKLFMRTYRIGKVPQIVSINGAGKVEQIHWGTLQEDRLKGLIASLN